VAVDALEVSALRSPSSSSRPDRAL
jgi:hypothetical protein